MKVSTIFAHRLYVLHYDGETENEYKRLMRQWTNTMWLYSFAFENKILFIDKFIQQTIREAEQIQNFVNELNKNNFPFEMYFQPLQLTEEFKSLAFQKGKITRNRLRLYAIKVDTGCFVITGGAIKMSLKMQDHTGTRLELDKLKQARFYFQKNNIIDHVSFLEFINESI